MFPTHPSHDLIIPIPAQSSSSPPEITLPPELILRIIHHAILPSPLCPRHLFDKCINPWKCPYGLQGHTNTLIHPPTVIPSPAISHTSHLFNHEAYNVFFKHNLFIFNHPGGSPSLLASLQNFDPIISLRDAQLSELRDPRASRLLNFIDKPHWVGVGSAHFQPHPIYNQIDTYRHLIRHLALKIELPYTRCHVTDWDWPLKVDWKTLPKLSTLYLDFRAKWGIKYYSGLQGEAGLEKLTVGAQRMKGMRLQRLVVVGLCSHEYFGNGFHEALIRRLFEPAMEVGRVVEMWDEQAFW